MIRHARRAAALFAVGALFASGAWAQAPTLAQSVTGAYLVAEELLGSADGTVIRLGSAGGTNTAARPAVRLTIPDTYTIPEGNEAEVTFTLTGAVFAQNVGASTLDLRASGSDHPGTVAAGLSTEVVEGGAVGDSSVTFLMEATGEIATNTRISFWVPDIRVTPTAIGRIPNPAGAGTVPVLGVGIVASLVERRAVRGTAATAIPFPGVSGGEDTPMTSTMMAMNNYMNRQVVMFGDVVNIAMGSSEGNTATVALNARTMFASSNATHMAQGSTTATRALRVGTLTVSINGGGTPADSTDPVAGQIYTLDPGRPAVDYNNTADREDDQLASSFAGNVDVVIKGAFKTGDMVFYGSPPTAAKISDGMAAVSVPLTVEGSQTPFIYVPGGIDPLRPGTITAVAMLNFSAAGNDPGRPAMSMGTISYAGVGVEAYAHGVVRGGGTDSSYVRVRCADAKGAPACVVFADCHDQDGMNYFDEAGAVPAGATAVVSSDMIAAALGGGWERGRGACDILSNGSLEVQHMVRAGHVLVNNSAVVGRSLSENRLKSIDDALADICASVDGHGMREANDANSDGDVTDSGDAAMIAATVCSNAFGRARNLSTIDTTPGTGEGNGGL